MANLFFHRMWNKGEIVQQDSDLRIGREGIFFGGSLKRPFHAFPKNRDVPSDGVGICDAVFKRAPEINFSTSGGKLISGARLKNKI